MSTLIAEKATMDRTRRTDADAAALIAAAVDDYRQLLPIAQRERLLAVCLEALDAGGEDAERLAGDLLAALCPDTPQGVRDTLAWICGDIRGR